MRRFIRGAALALLVATPSWAMADDGQMAQRIADALRNSGALVDYNIGINYSQRTATLRGQVQSEQQLANAMSIAKNVADVDKVVNELEVAPTSTDEVKSSGPSYLKPKMASSRGTANSDKAARRGAGSEPTVAAQYPALVQPGGQGEAGEQLVGFEAESQTQPVIGAAAQNIPVAYAQAGMPGAPIPAYVPGAGGGAAPVSYDHPHMPNYAWPSYAAYPNYAGLTYPKQYSATAWPYIGPFYPYPQVPLGWRKVTLEWDDGWWHLDFDDNNSQHGGRWW